MQININDVRQILEFAEIAHGEGYSGGEDLVRRLFAYYRELRTETDNDGTFRWFNVMDGNNVPDRPDGLFPAEDDAGINDYEA